VSLTIYADIKPMPSPRPRVCRFGTYMPKTYTAWKKEFIKLGKLCDQTSQQGRLSVFITCDVEPPISCSKKEREARLRDGVPAGDLDNHIKSILDAMQEAGVFANDNQVVKLVAEKKYAPKQGVTVKIAPY
jgi:Holliday junction resolvase RusA-like endonuclease